MAEQFSDAAFTSFGIALVTSFLCENNHETVIEKPLSINEAKHISLPCKTCGKITTLLAHNFSTNDLTKLIYMPKTEK